MFGACVGGALMGVAIVLFVEGGFGSDPMSTLLQGVSRNTSLSIDECNTLLSIAMVMASIFIDRKQIYVGTILFPLMSSLSIQIITPYMHAQDLLQRILYAMLGIIVAAFAIALSAKADCGKNPYDCLSYGLMMKFKLSYRTVRWIVDGVMLLTGILLSGTYGLITLLNMAVLGSLIMWILKAMDQLPRIHKTIYMRKKGGLQHETNSRNIS